MPDSTSPRRGPLVTTSEKTDDIRPRIASGVTVWLIVERQTALTESAAPATASSTAASHSDPASPHRRPRAPTRTTAQIVTTPEPAGVVEPAAS